MPNVGCGRTSHQIFLPVSMQFSFTRRLTKFSYALQDSNCSGMPVRGKRRKTVVRKDFEAGVAAHPEGRAGGKREEVRKEIANHIHHVDGGLLVGHGDVHVHSEDQQGACELLQLFDDILIALAGGDDLIDPARKGMSAGSGDVQSGAVSGGNQFVAGTVHFNAQFVDIFANVGARFDDGLMHFVLDLVGDARGGRGNELHDVRTQRTGGRIDDLEFFFDADSETVSHGRPSGGSVWKPEQ